MYCKELFSYIKESMEFQHPFTCIIAGPTGCGKSYFVKHFLDDYNNLF